MLQDSVDGRLACAANTFDPKTATRVTGTRPIWFDRGEAICAVHAVPV